MLPFRLTPAAMLAAFLAAAPSSESAPSLQMTLIDGRSGHPIASHAHGNETFVEARPEQRYAIRLDNLTGRRLLAVLSVDGVNVVTGQPASPDQAGYVLEPWQTLDITGWRKSLEDVAAFRFSRPEQSYAARTGRPDNVGVIGVAVFEERPRRPSPLPSIAEKASPAPASHAERAAAPAAEASLGTAHGEHEPSAARMTHFARAARPMQTSVLRYESRQALIDLGVLPGTHPPVRRPRPFPGGFVPDP